MSSQTSAALDRLDAALTRLEADREVGSVPESRGDTALAETEAMVEALRRDSMALMDQFQAQKHTTAQVADRLDTLILRVRAVLGE